LDSLEKSNCQGVAELWFDNNETNHQWF